MRSPYHIISSELSELGRFRIHLDTIRIDGNEYPYSYIEQKNSVGILAFDGEDIILIKQYRHALKSYEYEIPGGSIENGESPIEVASREMLEETGYSIERIEELGSYYPSPGSSDEICHLFVSWCTKRDEPKREPLELMSVELLSKESLEKMINAGQFKHSMGLVAWLKYKMRHCL